MPRASWAYAPGRSRTTGSSACGRSSSMAACSRDRGPRVAAAGIRTFLEDPLGVIQVGDREVRVRAMPVKSERTARQDRGRLRREVRHQGVAEIREGIPHAAPPRYHHRIRRRADCRRAMCGATTLARTERMSVCPAQIERSDCSGQNARVGHSSASGGSCESAVARRAGQASTMRRMKLTLAFTAAVVLAAVGLSAQTGPTPARFSRSITKSR